VPVCVYVIQCLCELVNEASFLYTTELDNVTSLCFRAMDSSNYDVRCDVAKLLGHLLAATQAPQAAQRQYQSYFSSGINFSFSFYTILR